VWKSLRLSSCLIDQPHVPRRTAAGVNLLVITSTLEQANKSADRVNMSAGANRISHATQSMVSSFGLACAAYSCTPVVQLAFAWSEKTKFYGILLMMQVSGWLTSVSLVNRIR
jgi:hypothetical protein